MLGPGLLIITARLGYNGSLQELSYIGGDLSMSNSRIWFLLFTVVFLTSPCLAQIGIPDLSYSLAFIAYEGPGTPSLLVVPDGNGSLFTEAHDEEGNVVDATITLIIRDSGGVPISNYPAEDCWLVSEDGGMVSCVGGVIASFSTDFSGMTQWVNPLFAGGYSLAPVRILIPGEPLPITLDLNFNSPDMNGDLVVNLADVALFASCYFTGYCYPADYDNNGVLNLADLSFFAEHIGAACP